MLKDLFSAVQKSLSDRVRDPLLGSYTVFFFIWNWRPITLLLFGSFGGFEDRLRYVQELYHFPKADMWGEYGPFWGCPEHLGAWCWSLFWNYGAPLVWTLAYLLVYPRVKRKIVVYWQKQETETINGKRAEEKWIALTPEESFRMRHDLDRLRSQLEKANREKFDVPQLAKLALAGAVAEEGGTVEDFAIAFAQISDSATIRPGHWMVMDRGTKLVTYREDGWRKECRACMVTHRLDGLMVIVQVAGSVDWSRRAKMWDMALTGNVPYILSERTKGAIRKAEASDWKLGEQFAGFVGYSEPDGSRLNLRDTKKE